MKKWKFSLMLSALLVFCASLAFAQFKFERPITIIVPWAAGGASDQVARVLAGEMEKSWARRSPWSTSRAGPDPSARRGSTTPSTMGIPGRGMRTEAL